LVLSIFLAQMQTQPSATFRGPRA